MKIKISTSFLFLFLLSGLLILFSFPVLGDDYKFETGIPGIVGPGQSLQALSLNDFIVKLIKILFPLAGILAFVMIVWAGFEYATSGGDTNKQKDAQDRITNAIIGLILLFAFYIIIYTINPDILKTQNISLPTVTTIPFTSKPVTQDLEYLMQIAKSFATKNKIAYNTDYSKLPTNELNLNNYFSALKTYGIANPEKETTHGASCDMYIAAVLRATIDPNYPALWVPNQYNYLTSKADFTCDKFTSLTQLRAGDILFTEDKTHTALKLDDGFYQASNLEYFPYGPSSSWYNSGYYCRYIHFSGGGSGGEAG